MADAGEGEDLDRLLEEGAAAQDRGDLATAANRYTRAIAASPDDPDANLLLGLVRWRQGNAEAAAELLRHAAERCPWHPQALLHWGRFATAAGRHGDAIASLRELVRIAPEEPLHWRTLAEARRRGAVTSQDLAEARGAAEQALALAPNDPDAIAERGRCLGAAGEHAAAAVEFERALRHGGEAATLRGLLAVALLNAGDAARARPHAVAAAEDPAADAAAWQRLATIHHALDDTAAAQAAFDRSIEASLREGRDPVVARLSRCTAVLPAVPRDEAEATAAWAAFGEAVASLGVAEAAPGPGGIEASGLLQPFHLPALGGPNREALSRFGDRIATAAAAAVAIDPRGAAATVRVPRRGRRRIGIVSGLFRNHVVARLFIDGWTSQIDRSRFEVVAFHTGTIRDHCTGEFAARCDAFVEGPGSLAAWTARVREADCDALLYPEIGMDPLAMLLASLRLAPLQAVAWGHPETPGLPTIDAFLTSEAMDPPQRDSHHREAVVPLPGLGAWIRRPAAEDLPAAMAPRRRGGEPIRLWLAQTPHKLHPRHDRLWADVAASLPEAAIVFAAHPGDASITARFRERLAAAFRESGADPARQIEIAPRRSRREHLAALAEASLFLDPPSWSGGQTTLEAISLGVPPLTLPGPFLRQRHAWGILRTIDPEGGLAETLVAASEEDYRERAVRLVRDEARRGAISAEIRAAAGRAYDDLRPIRSLEAWLDASLDARLEAGGDAADRRG